MFGLDEVLLYSKGETINKGAVIGANALVNKDIPEYEIWGGVPAKFIKKRI